MYVFIKLTVRCDMDDEVNTQKNTAFKLKKILSNLLKSRFEVKSFFHTILNIIQTEIMANHGISVVLKVSALLSSS